MFKNFLIIFFVCILQCSSHQQITRDKHSFFCPTVKEGYQFIESQGLELRKIDTLQEKTDKVYIFYYKFKSGN